jgi:hypothetical protein
MTSPTNPTIIEQDAASEIAIVDQFTSLPLLIDRAASALSSARSSAEVLEARDAASFAYDMAKRAGRLASAKGAHDRLVAAAHRAQADALLIESGAKRRLADEYDDAQERGEVASSTDGSLGRSNGERPATSADIGLTRKQVYEARQIRDAEGRDPGVIKRTLDDAVSSGVEPTKSIARRAVLQVVRPQREPAAQPSRGREAIGLRVRESVINLCGLPPAAEIAKYLSNSDAGITINDRLPEAIRWLNEFSAEWGSYERT